MTLASLFVIEHTDSKRGSIELGDVHHFVEITNLLNLMSLVISAEKKNGLRRGYLGLWHSVFGA